MKNHDGYHLILCRLGANADKGQLSAENIVSVTTTVHSIINDQPQHCLQSMITALNQKISAHILGQHTHSSSTATCLYSGSEVSAIWPHMPNAASIRQITCMIFCTYIESFWELEWLKGLFLLKKLFALMPGLDALISSVVAARHERHFLVIEKWINFPLYIFSKAFGACSSLVDEIEDLLDGNCRHNCFANIQV